MSRKVRYSFAAPLVMTLAVAPACVVRSVPPPPPSGDGAATAGPHTGPHTNPPPPNTRPATGQPDQAAYPDGTPGTVVGGGGGSAHSSTNPTHPRAPVVIDTVQQGPAPSQTPLSTWSVFLNRTDKACYARLVVQCPPKPATCNPPPARKLAACPEGFRVDDVDRPMTIVELSADNCYLQHPMPACPTGMSCNPPPPQKTECPR